jgi:hypothetical protein
VLYETSRRSGEQREIELLKGMSFSFELCLPTAGKNYAYQRQVKAISYE